LVKSTCGCELKPPKISSAIFVEETKPVKLSMRNMGKVKEQLIVYLNPHSSIGKEM
jgi:hypothetical protein